MNVLQTSVRRSELSKRIVHNIELPDASVYPAFDPEEHSYHATIHSSVDYATFVVEVYHAEADVVVRSSFKGFVNDTNSSISSHTK